MNLLIDIIHDWHEKHNFCSRISASCTIWTSITERTLAAPTRRLCRSTEHETRKLRTARGKAVDKNVPPEAAKPAAIRETAFHHALYLKLPVLIRTGKVSAGPSLSTKDQDRRQERSKAQAALASSDQARRRQGKNPDLPKSSQERKEAVPTSRRFL